MLYELLVMADGKISAAKKFPAVWGAKEGPPRFKIITIDTQDDTDFTKFKWDFDTASLMPIVQPNIDYKIAVCTTYFNHVSWQRRRHNFKMFCDALLSQHDELWVIEGGLDDHYEVVERDGLHLIRVSMHDVLWQKERLLNVLVDKLPPRYNAIAWLDSDILFDNPDWYNIATIKLKQYQVIQLFQHACWLSKYFVPEKWTNAAIGSIHRNSVAYDYEMHQRVNMAFGHPGYAWAIRRDILSKIGGFYDKHIIGSGDSVMAIGFFNSVQNPYLEKYTGPFKAECKSWASYAGNIVRGNVGYVPGILRHLWHGTRQNRAYDARVLQERLVEFDPHNHLELDENGLWRWSQKTPEYIKESIVEYLHARKEDG